MSTPSLKSLRNPLSTARAACLLWLVAAALLPMPTWASHGGPEVVEILGFDPVDEKIFYATHYQDESDYWPDVHYFNLKSARPWIPVRVDLRKGLDGPSAGSGDWRTPEHMELSDRISRLRQRLRPLPPSSTVDLTIRTRPLAADSIRIVDWKASRSRILVDLRDSTRSARVEITTYCDHRLGIDSVRRIPGRSWSLVVLSCTGIPVETCYELQSPVLLLPAAPPSRTLGSTRPGAQGSTGP